MPTIPGFSGEPIDPHDYASGWEDASTPGRQTVLVLDHTGIPQMEERWWGGTRMGAQICTPAARNQGKAGPWTRRVRYWPSLKFWTLEPIQERWHWSEQVPAGLTIDEIIHTPTTSIGYMKLNVIQTIQMRMNQVPYGTGMTHEAASGFIDYTWRKKVAASGSWNDTLSAPALPNPFTGGVVANTGLTALPTPSVPMDTVAMTTQSQREDLGMFLRWIVPGHQNLFPDYILTAYFGQYGLGIAGDGTAYLFEWCRKTESGAYRWRLRMQWQYCPPQAVSGINHTMTIFPCRGLYGEPYIIFSSRQVAAGAVTWGENHVPTQEVAYHASDINRDGDMPEVPEALYVTKRNDWRLDVRRDLRVAWSMARLMFWRTGQIIDSAWDTPPGVHASEFKHQGLFRLPYRGLLGGLTPIGSLDFIPYDGRDPLHPEIDLASPPADAIPYFLINFDGGGKETVSMPGGTRQAQSLTPILYGYKFWRESRFAPPPDPEATDPTITLSVRSLELQDPGPNPKLGGGIVETADMNGAFPQLRHRGHLMAKVVINYWPQCGLPQEGILHKVTIFSGVAIRHRHGKLVSDGLGIHDDPAECTTPRQMKMPLSNIATLGSEVPPSAIVFRNFTAETGTATDGNPKPWKVTDAIRMMLETRYSAAHVEIEDLNIRLFGALGISAGDLMFEPHDDIIARCEAMARNYLGRYLLWDTAAGPLGDDGSRDGAWRIIKIPDATAEPLASFFTYQPNESKPGMHPGAYAAEATTDFTVVLSEVDEGTLPPECNHVWVFAAPPQSGERYEKVDFHAYNPQSYKAPGFSIVPDRRSPHYIGYELPCSVPAPELWLSGDATKTKQACELVARRILRYAGCAKRQVTGTGTYCLIWDAERSTYRPLRYGDPVVVDGQSGWFVAACSPSYQLDTNQIASYELHKLIPHTDSGVPA